jgi:hypothetical protein
VRPPESSLIPAIIDAINVRHAKNVVFCNAQTNKLFGMDRDDLLAQKPTLRPASPQIDQLGGVWQRKLLVEPDGVADTSTDVIWLQFGELCADVRTPEGAESCQTAFAGVLRKRGDIFHWDPEWEFGTPPGAPPDEGYLCWQGNILREDGVHSAYLEHWLRLAEAGEADFGCRLVDGGGASKGLVIRIGAFAIFAIEQQDGTASFLLLRQDDEGWSVSASTPDHPVSGAGLNWADLLDRFGIGSLAADGSGLSATALRPIENSASEELQT